MSDAREKAVDKLARMLQSTDDERDPRGFDAEAAEMRDIYRGSADRMIQELGLVAVDPELVARVREADALVERLTAPHGRGDAIPIDNAQAEANERRQELADAVLAQIGGKP